MLAIFMAIAQAFIDSGFTNALIKKLDRTDKDFSTVFYFNLFISIVIYILLYLGAPFIAKFYRTSDLTDITRVYMLSLPIIALGAIQRTQFTIKVNFSVGLRDGKPRPGQDRRGRKAQTLEKRAPR